MAKKNNVDLAAIGAFEAQVKADPAAAKKHKKIEGSWNLDEGRPQFTADLSNGPGGGTCTVEADSPPFMGGSGRAPDPIQYCLYGLAACYSATFVSLASARGVTIHALKVTAENRVDLSRSLGLSDNPVVEKAMITLHVDSDADPSVLAELDRATREGCPGAYCLTNPIPLETRVESKK